MTTNNVGNFTEIIADEGKKLTQNIDVSVNNSMTAPWFIRCFVSKHLLAQNEDIGDWKEVDQEYIDNWYHTDFN